MRKLEINNETWTYMVGVKYAVIKSPTNKRFNVELTKIKNLTQDQITDGRNIELCKLCDGECAKDRKDGLYEKIKQGMVTPGEVKRYIYNTLVGTNGR